ncbi:MAG: cell division ATP-binding protein FtsE [Micrococcales bacterium]|nr:cell division ATP-binding protein FtsE [Micrococcales bacterium]
MIRFENVTKIYMRKAKPALNQVSLEIARSEFCFLVGSSGSGKSTMLSIILRQERVTSGHVFVLGQDVAVMPQRRIARFRRQIGAVFQDFRLLETKSVFDNVAFAMQVIGRPRHAIMRTVPDVLDLVGLAGKEKRLPHELSGGEQQRVAIARAVVNRPQVLLADEPTGNLDPKTSEGIMAVLERVNLTGTTVVMATHDVGLVDRAQHRVVELHAGQVVRDEASGYYGGAQ